MRHYYYLISSLPILKFGTQSPISRNNFLGFCREQLSSSDFKIITRVSILPYEKIEDVSSSLREWKRFDISLRNEIARSRATKKAKDVFAYIRGEDSTDPFIAPFAHLVANQDSPLEAELSIDRKRWDKIEELKKGHYFDIDYLIAYMLELQILERWERINLEDSQQVLENLLDKEQEIWMELEKAKSQT